MGFPAFFPDAGSVSDSLKGENTGPFDSAKSPGVKPYVTSVIIIVVLLASYAVLAAS
jgi:hypothetical protein